jgi:hypothetical protein
MKEFYAKYLPKLGAKPFKMSGSLKAKHRSFIHHKRGVCIYLGKNLSIEAQLFLCSSEYKKGDTIKIIGGEEIKNVTIVKSGLTNHKLKYWTVKENKNWYYKDFIGKQHFKVIAQISQFAVWVKEYTGSNEYDDDCTFDESDIRILGEHRGVHDDGSYNLCLIKCPTCEHLH